MTDKTRERIYLRKWKRANKDKVKLYSQRYEKKNPWSKYKRLIATRCSMHPLYLRLGVKNAITTAELKKLWFRDKAYLLERPSIDRIEREKSYTLDNCRFIELFDNLNPKPVYQKTLDGKVIAKFKSMSEASRSTGCHCSAISNCIKRGHRAGGYRWELIPTP